MGAIELKVSGVDDAADALEDFGTGVTAESAWIVSVGAHYGAYVEFGTSRMQAQPYLYPAARKVMIQDYPRLEARALQTSDPIESIVQYVALTIEGEAKLLAPVDTGFLRSSIQAAPANVF